MVFLSINISLSNKTASNVCLAIRHTCILGIMGKECLDVICMLS